MEWVTWSQCSNHNAVVLEMLMSQSVMGKEVIYPNTKTDSGLVMTGWDHSDHYDFTHFLVWGLGGDEAAATENRSGTDWRTRVPPWGQVSGQDAENQTETQWDAESEMKWKRTQSPVLCRKEEDSSKCPLGAAPVSSGVLNVTGNAQFNKNDSTGEIEIVVHKHRVQFSTVCLLMPHIREMKAGEIQKESRLQNRCGSSHFRQTDLFFFFSNDLVLLNKTRLKSSHRARCFLPPGEKNEVRDQLLVILWRTRTQLSLEAGCGSGSKTQQLHLRHAASVPEDGQKWVLVARVHLKWEK